MLPLKRVIVQQSVETYSSFHTVMTRSLKNYDLIRVPGDFYTVLLCILLPLVSRCGLQPPFKEFVSLNQPYRTQFYTTKLDLLCVE